VLAPVFLQASRDILVQPGDLLGPAEASRPPPRAFGQLVAQRRRLSELCDRIGDLGIPVVSELPFGHDGVNAALPVGVQAELDGDRGHLTLLAPAG